MGVRELLRRPDALQVFPQTCCNPDLSKRYALEQNMTQRSCDTSCIKPTFAPHRRDMQKDQIGVIIHSVSTCYLQGGFPKRTLSNGVALRPPSSRYPSL